MIRCILNAFNSKRTMHAGGGKHHCIGSPIARGDMSEALKLLAQKHKISKKPEKTKKKIKKPESKKLKKIKKPEKPKELARVEEPSKPQTGSLKKLRHRWLKKSWLLALESEEVSHTPPN